MDVRVSVVVATLNRASELRALLDTLQAQDTSVPFEIIVADNGSTDGTAAVVRAAASGRMPVRCVREERPGVSYARNAGAAIASAPILAFTDDDQHVVPTWVETIDRTFDAHADVQAIGGRVLPMWPEPTPPWFTPALRGAVSIFDRGEQPVRLHRRQWMCLPGGNLAIRRDVFAALGGFDPAYRRSQDRELTVRLLSAGYHALYVPQMVVYHRLDADRLTKSRFRAWSMSEGRMRAGYAFEELFTADGEILGTPLATPRILGVSRFVYRQLGESAARYAAAVAARRKDDAFREEMRVRYYWAYVNRRRELARTAAARDDGRLAHLWRGTTAAVARLLTLVVEFLG